MLYSDIGCPWGSLTVHRLRRHRSRRGLDAEVVIDHRAFPLELFNQQLVSKRTIDAESVIIGAHEPSLGWSPWHRAERHYPFTTLLPMEAVQAAKAAVGGLRAGEDLDAALRQAWFAESRSIHLWAELLAVAADVASVDAAALETELRSGAGRAAVFRQWEDAKAVAKGSPHLFLADGTSWHNPGISHDWSGGANGGMPRITADDDSVYDDILDRAGRL